MNRTANIAVIKIGYSSYAFEDAQTALELMAILSRAVPVDVKEYGMDKMTSCTHFLEVDRDMPEMKFIAASKFNPHETVDEIKERYAREQADREDLDQHMREAPAALPAPAAIAEDEEFPF